ncbi:wnt inhibitor of Dorsal protein-like [Stomoxys calcitrans]|uniref:Protein Wnt n=1 Tax=Stomoxys calcitrans TaxID=35570 RepID=A0A1I8NXR3_STOCA|nr:wnt inhibitor of Dorsal protein-like [Stomoxys calcitrans]
MYHKIITAIVMVALAWSTEARVSLLDKFNYIAGQSQYANQIYAQLQLPFSLDTVMASSMEIAMENCQSAFKWDRWNCPSSDFILRRTSKSPLMDREDAYVNAISTAALLYTITKNCSSGIIAGCGSCSDSAYTTQCSDNPQAAEKLFKKHLKSDFSNEFYGKLFQQNYKAITNLLQKSLTKKCVCAVMGPGGVCANEICLDTLKPFEEIAKDIRQMYDEGLELSNTPENSRIMWENIPLDVLVYMNDSPNYCEPDAVPLWNGMRGRQCSMANNGEALSEEDSLRCRHLCSECGYSVETQSVMTETRCNCKFTWGFQVQCEMCVTVQKLHYCY